MLKSGYLCTIHGQIFLIPDYMIGGIQRFIKQGVIPGGFLSAVLENNMKEAYVFADENNISNFPAYMNFLYNEVPSECWGSPEKVKAWSKMKREE